MTSLVHSARGDTHALLARAVDLLRAVAEEVTLPPTTHQRVHALLRDVAAPPVDPDAPTVLARPRLVPLRLTIRQFIVVDRALRSSRLACTFDNIHDFLLVAARAFHFAPAPDFTHVDTAGASGVRTIAFKTVELDEVRAAAVSAGASSAEAYVLGCGFAWLSALAVRWPDDVDLNAHLRPRAAAVTIHHFPKRRT